jgi:beta-glucanase (GH16 family)
MSADRKKYGDGFLFLLAVAGLISSVSAAHKDEGIAQYPGLKLVWNDEFDRDGRPDPNHWDFELGFVRNNELQWYQPDNAVCENGLLVIEGRREQKPNPAYDPAGRHWARSRPFIEYTSASLRTRGRHSWQYGRFEIRAKIDARDGLWPAIWLLGQQRRWPQCGEIDIMEYYRGMILANVAWADPNAPGTAFWRDSKTKLADLIQKSGNPNWADEFHVWRMDWNENKISLYVDTICLNEVDINEATGADGFNPFRQPHYLLLNLAIGGTQGGDPSKTEFPSRYKIDYVRVYQRD